MDPKALAHLGHHLNIFKKVLKTDSAYVAGGALRDLDNDKEVNDIDIFVYANDTLKRQLPATRDKFTKRFTYVGELENIYGKESESLIKKYETQWSSGLRLFDIRTIPHRLYPLQLILYTHPGTPGPRKLVEFFDINLCRISFNGEQVFRSAEYKSDVENKKITVNPYFVGQDRTNNRIKKLEKKFEGFTSVIPEAQRREETVTLNPLFWSGTATSSTRVSWTDFNRAVRNLTPGNTW